MTPQEIINQFESVVKQRAKDNNNEVIKTARKLRAGGTNKDTKDLELKIVNWRERWSRHRSILYYVEKIVNDKDFATNFAKQPSKQNIYEKLQFEFLIESLSGIATEVEKLPPNGPNMLYLEGGCIVSKDQLKQSSKNLKNLDVKITLINGLIVYGTLKYTGKWFGGEQDNQKHDVMNCLQQHNLSSGVLFFAGLDGPYYHSEKGKKNLEEFDDLQNSHLTVGSVATISEGIICWAQI